MEIDDVWKLVVASYNDTPWIWLFSALGLVLSLIAQSQTNDQRLLWLNSLGALSWGGASLIAGSASAWWLQVLLASLSMTRIYRPYWVEYSKTPVVALGLALLIYLALGDIAKDFFAFAGTVLLIWASIRGKQEQLRYCFLIAASLFLFHALIFEIWLQAVACVLGIFAILYSLSKIVLKKRRDNA